MERSTLNRAKDKLKQEKELRAELAELEPPCPFLSRRPKKRPNILSNRRVLRTPQNSPNRECRGRRGRGGAGESEG